MTGHLSTAPDRPRPSSSTSRTAQELKHPPHPQAGAPAADPAHDRLVIGIGSYDRRPLHQLRHRRVATEYGTAL
jgi:hypothetical protein